MSETDRIVSKDDIIRILKDCETSKAEVSSDLHSFELEIVRSVGQSLVLSRKLESPSSPSVPFAPGEFELGAKIEIVFSLVDGQYAIRDEVRDLTQNTFTVDASHGVLRLQRRNDFRVAIARGAMHFLPAGRDPSTAPALLLDLIDLSAGGLRLLWPPAAGPIPKVEERLNGELVLKPGPSAESVDAHLVFVKDHGFDSPLKPELGRALSFKFEGLSQDDARAVLFAGLRVYRSRYGS